MMPTDAKARKGVPLYSGLLKYFPLALIEVAKCSQAGNDQHNGVGTPLRWDRSKSTDEADALLRHLLDHATGVPVDVDGVPHLAKVCWRSLALLQKELENERSVSSDSGG